MLIDLHTHSTFSDGSFTPVELARHAAEAGVGVLALTDHDTTDGTPALLDECAALTKAGRAIEGIAGVEISARSPSGTLHMLGYFVRHQSDELETLLRRIRNGREERNARILERLRAQGMPLEWEEVAALSSEGVVGRPHIAQAMVARGYAATTLRAFQRHLGRGHSAYCERYRPTPAESIQAIAAAGGVAVLAHPLTLDMRLNKLRILVAELKACGLQGIEVFYPEHTRDHEVLYLELARDQDLVAVGGSDFHGAANPAIRIGLGFGRLQVPAECVAELQSRCHPAS